MASKTCGECRFYFPPNSKCPLYNDNVSYGNKACDCFVYEKQTNGDKIRQMSNEKLKRFITCPYIDCIHALDGYSCVECRFDWLNAPAESEGNNDTDR